jgi:hypothetical protein
MIGEKAADMVKKRWSNEIRWSNHNILIC